MKIQRLAVPLFLLLLASQKAEAEGNPSIVAVNRSFDVAYVLGRTYYLEPSDAYSLVTHSNYLDYEIGNTQGLEAGLSWMTDQGWYAKLVAGHAEGKLGYTGYYQPSFTPANATTRSTTQDLGIKLGRGFPLGGTWMLTPYLTAGYHHQVREVGLGSTSDLTESYRHLYYGFGGMAQYSPWTSWVFTGDAALGRTYNPAINAPSVGLNNTSLGAGPVIMIRLEADYGAAQWLHLFARVGYTEFMYGQSSIQYGGNAPAAGVMEPSSQTQIYGVSAGFRFPFATSLKLVKEIAY